MNAIRIRWVLAGRALQMLFLGYLLGMSGCTRISEVRPEPLVVVTFNWDAWVTAARAESAYVSVEGPLLNTVQGRHPGTGIKAIARTVDGKEYEGIAVVNSKDRTVCIMEVLVYGEDKRVLIRADSRVAFAVRSAENAGTKLTWVVCGEKRNEPIDLIAGTYQIEVLPDESEDRTSVQKAEPR